MSDYHATEGPRWLPLAELASFLEGLAGELAAWLVALLGALALWLDDLAGALREPRPW